MEQGQNKHLGPWGLREEARKSWDYIVSDKLVYIGHHADSKLNPLCLVSEKYSNHQLWCELHITLHYEGHPHFVVVAESVFDHREQAGKFDTGQDATNGDQSVLINIAQGMQLPEGIVLVGWPSFIRLKVFDDVRCLCGYILQDNRQFTPGVGGIIPKDRESRFPGRLPFTSRCEQGQLPSKMVQARAEGVNIITCENPNSTRGGIQFHFQDILTSYKIVLCDDLKGFCIMEGCNFPIERVQVFFRPFQFGFNVLQTCHSNNLAQTLASKQ